MDVRKFSENKNTSEKSLINKRLKDIREGINSIDEQLLDILNRRAEFCMEVGKIKSTSKESIFKPFREKEVLERLKALNPGVLPEDHLLKIYREILSSSRKLQRPQEVMYLGPEGTFSYFVGVEYLGHSTDFKPCNNLKDVFRSVASKEAELGIIPLENSLRGSVGQSLDMFLDYDVYIQAEVFCKISHSLLSSENSLSDIQTVYSHPKALEQCSEWLRIHLPDARIIPMESTARAAEKVVNQEKCAAVGHNRLGKMFNLNILTKNIEDLPDNWTRFMIIGSTPPKEGDKDKTSILFTLPDKSGALVQVLNILARNGLNMKKLESRPMPTRKWNYVFFTDIECDLTGIKYEEMINDLNRNCKSLRILGSYPAGSYLDVV